MFKLKVKIRWRKCLIKGANLEAENIHSKSGRFEISPLHGEMQKVPFVWQNPPCIGFTVFIMVVHWSIWMFHILFSHGTHHLGQIFLAACLPQLTICLISTQSAWPI